MQPIKQFIESIKSGQSVTQIRKISDPPLSLLLSLYTYHHKSDRFPPSPYLSDIINEQSLTRLKLCQSKKDNCISSNVNFPTQYVINNTLSVQPWWPSGFASQSNASRIILRLRVQIRVLPFVFQILICFVSVSSRLGKPGLGSVGLPHTKYCINIEWDYCTKLIPGN